MASPFRGLSLMWASLTYSELLRDEVTPTGSRLVRSSIGTTVGSVSLSLLG